VIEERERERERALVVIISLSLSLFVACPSKSIDLIGFTYYTPYCITGWLASA
jgi:hypothetical protein